MQEYCNGGSLRSALQRGMFAQVGMPDRWRSVQSAMRGLAAGMAYTHSKRICHGDLNPSNVLLKARPSPPSLPPPLSACVGPHGRVSIHRTRRRRDPQSHKPCPRPPRCRHVCCARRRRLGGSPQSPPRIRMLHACQSARPQQTRLTWQQRARCHPLHAFVCMRSSRHRWLGLARAAVPVAWYGRNVAVAMSGATSAAAHARLGFWNCGPNT